jgi:protein-disulfide isomerase
MYEVQAALEKKQQEERQEATLKTLSEDSDAIFNSPTDGIVGNPEGSVTIVEFFDYNCGYCRRAMADMEAMVKDDPNLRFVLKEFPILGPDSQKAHVVSMAFRALAPEKYADFHVRLLSAGRANEETAIKIATDLGVDEAALRQEMQNPEIVKAFEATYQLADRLQITGTPAYVVGKEVVFGALGRDVLLEKLQTAQQ